MKSRINETWAAGKGALNAWLSIPSTITAELAGKQDFDSVTVDLQHGLNDYTSALPMLQALATSKATAMARVPWLEPGIIMKLLDAGALGLICPMVNSREEAEAFVRYSNYAPKGERSFGPTRAVVHYGADYAKHANDTIVTLAMIETTRALSQLDDIVKTDGLTGVYIGPSDLSLSMGYEPKLDQEEPAVVEAIHKILGAAKNAGMRAGIHCMSSAYANKMLAAGFDVVTLGGSDIRIYSAAMGSAVSDVRAGMGG